MLEPGLDEAARVLLAALSVIGERSHRELMDIRRENDAMIDPGDAFNLLSVAQNETDYWLRSSVRFLAAALQLPAAERSRFAEKLRDAYLRFPRRTVQASIDVRDLERIVSLPAWKYRHELYGVWVASEMISSVEGHDVEVHHDDGSIEFAFHETVIADIKTSTPPMQLVTERRTRLSNPIGKSRKDAAQPDFGLWQSHGDDSACVAIVEVKHYKKPSRSNFREALVDYARAHPDAVVVLVNYGPVGVRFDDLPKDVEERCTMIGPLTPLARNERSLFNRMVLDAVGPPPDPESSTTSDGELFVIDVSASMSRILKGNWFEGFLQATSDSAVFALIDTKLHCTIGNREVLDWLQSQQLGGTDLVQPLGELLHTHGAAQLITDDDGIEAIDRSAICVIRQSKGGPDGAMIARVELCDL